MGSMPTCGPLFHTRRTRDPRLPVECAGPRYSAIQRGSTQVLGTVEPTRCPSPHPFLVSVSNPRGPPLRQILNRIPRLEDLKYLGRYNRLMRLCPYKEFGIISPKNKERRLSPGPDTICNGLSRSHRMALRGRWDVDGNQETARTYCVCSVIEARAAP